MRSKVLARLALLVLLVLGPALFFVPAGHLQNESTLAARFAISFPETHSKEPLDGRMLLLISTDNSREPRFQINEDLNTQQVFGVDVDRLDLARK